MWFPPQAFLAASLKSDEELWAWFRERLIWDNPAVVKDLLRNGLFYRIYTPQVCRPAPGRPARASNPAALYPRIRHETFL